MQPGIYRPQEPAGDLWTFSDIFVLKGLVAASARFAPEETARHVAGLMQVVRAIEDGRFVSDERQPLDAAALTRERGDFGPRMIMLGAAALLRDVGETGAAAFGFRFIDHVLATNMIRDGRRAACWRISRATTFATPATPSNSPVSGWICCPRMRMRPSSARFRA